MSLYTFRDGVLREKWDDAARMYTSYDESDVRTRPYTAEENAAADAAAARETIRTNLATLRARGQTALTNNKAFLALPTPTNAQSVTQLQRLTRQMDGMIRLLLEMASDISDA